MIKPVNGHLLIDPIKHESFMASQRETYEEVGIVLDVDVKLATTAAVTAGDKVFFDSYLAARYPKADGTENFFWLVKWEDVRAIDPKEIQ